MDRRRFLLTSLAGTLAGPPPVQLSPGRMYRIGILANIPLADPEGAPLFRRAETYVDRIPEGRQA